MKKHSAGTNNIKEEIKNFGVVFGLVSFCYALIGFVFFLFKIVCHVFTWSWDNFWTENNTFMLYWFLGMWLATLVFGILSYMFQGMRALYKKIGPMYRTGTLCKNGLKKILNSSIFGWSIFCIILYFLFGPTIYGWVNPFIHKEYPLNCPKGQQNVLYFYNPLFSETNDTETAYTCCSISNDDVVDAIEQIIHDENGKTIMNGKEFVEQKFPIGANSSGQCCPKGTQGMRYKTLDGKILTTCCSAETGVDYTGTCCSSGTKAMYLPSMNVNQIAPTVCCSVNTERVDSSGRCCPVDTHHVLYIKPQKKWDGLKVNWRKKDAAEQYVNLLAERKKKYGELFANMLTLREVYDEQQARGYRDLDNEPELSAACCTKEQKEADSQGNCCQTTEHAVYYMKKGKVHSKCCSKQFDFVDKTGNCTVISK